MKKKSGLLIALGIILVSFNLRAPITAVGSLVKLIQTDYALSNSIAGFVTTLPLLVFAVVSPFVASFAKKRGMGNTMIAGLLFIIAGLVVRSYTGRFGLFLGTAVIGVGIAIGNVLIPSIIKHYFPHRVGPMTSIYTSSMCIFAALGAGVSVPLASGWQLGWRHALAVWLLLTCVTLVWWIPHACCSSQDQQPHREDECAGKRPECSVWRSPLAWYVTLFMGIQSLLFYSLTAWLPTIIISKGHGSNFAGSMALVYQLIAIPATLLFPFLCGKWRSQRGLSLSVALLYCFGIVLLWQASSVALLCISIVVMSFAMGGAISLAIAFISLRSANAADAAKLSGMSQSTGYLLAAAGPLMTGFLLDVSGSWDIAMMVFLVLIALLSFWGYMAGADRVMRSQDDIVANNTF